MACGKAVVVSRAGGAAEIVQDCVDAIATDPGDADALARALDRCAADPALRARLGAAARRSALERFDPDTFVRRFLDVYTKAAPAAASA